jgi:hypothetical protein
MKSTPTRSAQRVLRSVTKGKKEVQGVLVVSLPSSFPLYLQSPDKKEAKEGTKVGSIEKIRIWYLSSSIIVIAWNICLSILDSSYTRIWVQFVFFIVLCM